MIDDFKRRRRTLEPTGEYERPTEFRAEPGELTDDPVPDYPSNPHSTVPEGYFVEHGETSRLEATPVFMVEPPPQAQNWTDWTTSTVALNPQPVQFGDATRTRIRFVVRNLDAANPVYVSRLRSDLAPMATFQLPPNSREEFLHNGPICLSAPVAGTLATFYAEIDVPDPA